MKFKTAFCLLAITALTTQGQPKINIVPEPLVARKTIQFGFQTSFALGLSTEGRQMISSNMFNPKVSYFIADRFSIGLGYVGVSSNISPSRRNNFYHNGELELKYFLNNRSNTLFYTQLGFLYGQYKPIAWNTVGSINREAGAMLKMGAGVMWRFKKAPNLAFNLEVNNYFNLKGSNSRLQYAPNLSIGVSFFMGHKKKKSVPEQQKQLGGF